MEGTEDFILFLLSSIRAGEKSAPYRIRFKEGALMKNGYRLPEAVFLKGKRND